MNVQKEREIADTVYRSPWRNAYWFARMLLNTDQYGAIGKRDGELGRLTTKCEAILTLSDMNASTKFTVCRDSILNGLRDMTRKDTKARELAEALAAALDDEFNSLDDIVVFLVTVRYIVLPTNEALRRIPNNDIAFCKDAASDILGTLGEAGVGRVVEIWDKLGVRGCLDVERMQVVQEFTKLRRSLVALPAARSELEDNALLTAFVQEFERRAGQKRKGRAGTSLEDVSTFLFDYYGFSSHPKPDHFQTDIEVDKLFRCLDGWSIGISCKRTLRERWKQVSSADGNVLSRHKIKQIWHLTTYDKDLSDDKITMLGGQRQVFYLDDESERYRTASTHPGMRDYVRPLSSLIGDIRREQKK